MQLSRRAVKAFLDRPHRDYSRWKRLSERRLLRRMSKLPIRPPIWNPLAKHQRVCLVIGARKRRFAFFNDTGTGKTYLSIALMSYFKKLAGVKKRANLVLVPNKINKWEWLEEGFEKHAPKMKCVVLHGSTAYKWRLIDENPDADCFVETYMGFVRLISEIKEVKRKRGKKNKLVPNKTKLRRLQKLFKGIYLDESTYVKNKTSLPYRICNQLSKTAEDFFALTATPFGRDVQDVWAQVFLVDRGETLGETLTLFREAYFERKDGYWGGFEYKLKPEDRERISQRLDNISIAYPADEADMPHLTRVPKYAKLDEDASVYYDKAKNAIMKARGDRFEMKSAFTRMRQISSGFVGFKDDETGDRASYVFPNNPKLDMLEALVTTFRKEHKFIVFHEFNHSSKVICDKLKELGIGHVAVYGKTKNSAKALEQFKRNPKIQAMVLSNSAGGYGLNLQNAKYGIYYEAPVGAILRRQTERRFYRQYSLHKRVVLFDLIVRGTVDETILAFHREGRSLWKAIINYGADKALRKRLDFSAPVKRRRLEKVSKSNVKPIERRRKGD